MTSSETLPHAKPLKDRLKGAASWTAGGHVAAQVIKLGSNLVMTYLLLPNDFGLMAIVGVLLVGLTLISDVGITQSLIANPRGSEASFRNTVWTLQIVRGFGTWALASVVALGFWGLNALQVFPADSVYADDRLPWVIVGTFTQAAIQGFQSTKLVIAQRNVSVREMVLLKLYAQVLALIPMFLIAFTFRSVWALVAGGVTAILVQVVLSHTMVPGQRDRLEWNRDVLDELWSFGRWIMLSSFIGFMASCGDRILLGHYLSASTLGLYAIAGLLVAPLQSIFTMMVSSIAFPGLSEVHRTRSHDLPRTYVKFQRYADVLSVGGAAMLMVMGPSVVEWLYKSAYHPAGPMLSILAVGLAGMRYYVVEQCYVAKGQTRLMTAANALRLLALFTFIPLGFHFHGLDGAVLGVALAPYASWPLALYFRHQQKLGGLAADAWVIPSLLGGSVAGYLASSLFAALPALH